MFFRNQDITDKLNRLWSFCIFKLFIVLDNTSVGMKKIILMYPHSTYTPLLYTHFI